MCGISFFVAFVVGETLYRNRLKLQQSIWACHRSQRSITSFTSKIRTLAIWYNKTFIL